MKNKQISLAFILCLTFISVFSQEIEKSKNLVLTVSIKYDVHKTTNVFHWLIPYDSIDRVKNEFKIYPLYMINDFSNDKLLSCISGEKVNFFEYTTNTNFNYEKDLVESIKILDSIINEHKILVQKINKRWKNRSKLKAKIYVTSVEGNFQFCTPTDKMKKRFDLDDFITIPLSNFKCFPEILKDENVIEFLHFTDFSKFSISNRVMW